MLRSFLPESREVRLVFCFLVKKIVDSPHGCIRVEWEKGGEVPSVGEVGVLDEFVTGELPIGYCFFKRSVFGVVGFEVVVDGSGGVFELRNIVFMGFGDDASFENFL